MDFSIQVAFSSLVRGLFYLLLANWAHTSILKAASSESKLLYSTTDFWLVVQYHVQQGTVDFNLLAVVIDKAQFPKFVHEKTHARSRRADHLRQCLLADFC